jgi:FtsZ-binding cell division protein ZapB
MIKQRTNERSIDSLYLEIDQHKREKAELRKENDSLRNNNVMLINIFEDLVNDESYWTTEVSTKTMLWRLKNILNNLKNS